MLRRGLSFTRDVSRNNQSQTFGVHAALRAGEADVVGILNYGHAREQNTLRVALAWNGRRYHSDHLPLPLMTMSAIASLIVEHRGCRSS